MAEPLLEVDDLIGRLPDRGRRRPRGGPGQLHASSPESSSGSSASPAAASRRCCSAVAQLLSPPGEVVGGKVIFRGRDMVRLGRGELQQHALARLLGRDAERDERAQPDEEHRRAVQGHPPGARQRLDRGDPAAVGRGHEAGGDRPRPPPELSPPAQRRDAPAGDDRDGAAVHASARDHGRADVSARRGRAAIADDQDQGSPAKPRVRRHLRHPRHVGGEPLLRSRARDVRRPDRGGSPDRRDLRAAPAPVHPRSDERVPVGHAARAASWSGSPERRRTSLDRPAAAASIRAARRSCRRA